MVHAQSFTFVAYGDTRSHPADHAAVVREIVKLHPEFVVQTGDLVADGRVASQWAEFDRITKPLRDAHIPYYPTRGNHDRGDLYLNEVTQPFDSGTKSYYAFTRHGNRFIMIDDVLTPYGPGSAQYKWLVSELAKGSSTAVNMFVVFHASPYSVGPHGPNPEAQRVLHPLFVKYKPRAVFCGHDHLYYRTKRDGVNYIVTGGGGAELYAPTHRSTAIPGDVFVRQHHVVYCVVSGKTVTGTAITPSGKVIDRFTFGP